jgi:hypothetical protein
MEYTGGRQTLSPWKRRKLVLWWLGAGSAQQYIYLRSHKIVQLREGRYILRGRQRNKIVISDVHMDMGIGIEVAHLQLYNGGTVTGHSRKRGRRRDRILRCVQRRPLCSNFGEYIIPGWRKGDQQMIGEYATIFLIIK